MNVFGLYMCAFFLLLGFFCLELLFSNYSLNKDTMHWTSFIQMPYKGTLVLDFIDPVRKSNRSIMMITFFYIRGFQQMGEIPMMANVCLKYCNI